MQPSTAHSPQSAEDLDAVLVRFQAWSGSRKTKEEGEGVRELSYEDALQSSRYRWQARPYSPRAASMEKAGAILEPVTETTSQTSPAPPNEISEDSTFADDAFAPDIVTLSSAEPGPRAEAVVHAKGTPPPRAFRTMLEEAVLPAPLPGSLALVWPSTPKSERQVSMSLRLAPSEQALIKARAAEAGLSASAYLRQCALEVEQLRTQVQHTLAVIERNSMLALSASEAPVQAPSPGFFARLRQRIFGGSDTGLALRT